MDDKDKKFIAGLESNLDEIKAEQAAGTQIEEQLAKAQPVTGAEAQQMVREELGLTGAGRPTAEAGASSVKTGVTGAKVGASDFLTAEEERAQKAQLAEKRGVNVPLVVLIAVVVLVLAAAAGYAAVRLLGGGRENPDTSMSGNGGDSGGEGGSEGDGSGNDGGDNSTGVEELAVDDELVQRLWRNFDIIKDPWSRTKHFYIADGVAQGNVDDMLMVAVALSQVEQKSVCDKDYMLSAEASFSLSQYGCYDADAVRAKVKEIFGKEIELAADGEPLAYINCHSWTLNAGNQEIYDSTGPGCGGVCIPVTQREIEKAERSEDAIYIYELVYMEACDGIYHLGTELNTYEYEGRTMLGMDSLKLGEPIAQVGVGDVWSETPKVNIDEYRGQFDEFKWTFVKDAEGNYVFAGLEKVK